MFFENADKFIDFFLREWELLEAGLSHLESRNFILVPIHFTSERLTVDESSNLGDQSLIDLEKLKRNYIFMLFAAISANSI